MCVLCVCEQIFNNDFKYNVCVNVGKSLEEK